MWVQARETRSNVKFTAAARWFQYASDVLSQEVFKNVRGLPIAIRSR